MEKSTRVVFSVSYFVFQLLLHSDASCPTKLLPGGTLTPTYAVGDIAELKCDVSSRNALTDTLHWKRGNEIMSQDKIVVTKYIKKFNVSLEANVYTLRFFVEPNDSEKYNCTCSSGGLQYTLLVKTPCNNCSYVTGGSLPEVIRSCKKGAILRLTDQKHKEPVGVELDCGCTSIHPGEKRKFQWRWKFQQTKYSSLSIAKNKAKTVTFVQPNRTPTGCYNGTEGVTYRYQNITTIFNDTFQCPWNQFGLYSLYVDDEIGTGEEAIFKVCCQDGYPECPIQPLLICFIVSAAVDLFCIIIVIYGVFSWRRQLTEEVPNDQWYGFLYILITVGIVALIILLALIGVAVTQAQGGYTKYITKNCEYFKCTDHLDSGQIVGTIILVIITSLIIILVVWQVYYRVTSKKGYAVGHRSTSSVDSTNVLTSEIGQEMNDRNPAGNGSQRTVNSGTTATTERTEFGLKEFGPQETSLDYRKKDSISEDEGVHVGGEAPSVSDIGNVNYIHQPVSV